MLTCSFWSSLSVQLTGQRREVWLPQFCISLFVCRQSTARADVVSILSSDQCQTEDKQRGVCEPRDPVAAAVPEERHQQVSLVKRANVGGSSLTAPSTPHYLSTSTLYKCKISVKPQMCIWTHITGSLYKQTIFNWSVPTMWHMTEREQRQILLHYVSRLSGDPEI